MIDLLVFGALFALATGFAITSIRANIHRLRETAEWADEQADLHRQIAKLEVELAKVAFGEDRHDLAKARLEKADLHTKTCEKLHEYADRFSHYASFPLRSVVLRRDRPSEKATGTSAADND